MSEFLSKVVNNNNSALENSYSCSNALLFYVGLSTIAHCFAHPVHDKFWTYCRVVKRYVEACFTKNWMKEKILSIGSLKLLMLMILCDAHSDIDRIVHCRLSKHFRKKNQCTGEG